MHCFRCGTENADGSRFCGNCGASFGDEPVRHTDPTREIAQGAAMPSGGLPALSRGGRPALIEPMPESSLGGESLRVPVSKGARAVTIAIVLLVDVAMVIAGVVLMTRDGGGRGPASAEDKAAADAVVGPGPLAVTDAGSVTGPGRVPGTGSGTGTGTRSGSGTGTGTGTGTGAATAIDAGVSGGPDARIPDAPDAAPMSGMPDARIEPAPDAGVEPAPVDAGTGDPDDGARDLADQVSVRVTRSQSKLSACYTRATKGLPDDQPLTGDVDISFEVVPTGEARSVTVKRNTTGSNTLATCVVDVVDDWTFTPFTGEPVEFMRPFRFGPRG